MILRKARPHLFCVTLFICASSIARAQWVEKSSTFAAAAAPGLIHRVLTAQNSSGEVAEIDLAEFNLRRSPFRLRLIDNGDRSMDLAEAMQRSGCLAGTNGGYFDPDFLPIGLRIANGLVV